MVKPLDIVCRLQHTTNRRSYSLMSVLGYIVDDGSIHDGKPSCVVGYIYI